MVSAASPSNKKPKAAAAAADKVPKYTEMVLEAIKSVKEYHGSTIAMIRNEMQRMHADRFSGDQRPVLNAVKNALTKLIEEGLLKYANDHEDFSGSARFKVVPQSECSFDFRRFTLPILVRSIGRSDYD